MTTNNVAISDPKRDLRELLLANLDLIHQQQELLIEKDLRIKSLQQENETLKCRLERIERRMLLRQQKRQPAPYTPVTQTKTTVDQSVTKSSRPAKRKLVGSVLESTDASDSDVAVQQMDRLVSREHIDSRKNHPVAGSKAAAVTVAITNKAQSRQSAAARDLTNVIKRTIDISGRSRSNADMLTTDILYYSLTTDNKMYCITQLDEEPVVYSTDVPVPSWRINIVHGLYVIEGTENLNDSMFMKRHQKNETEEKRRKRWDVQRLRDLHLLQKNTQRSTNNITDSQPPPQQQQQQLMEPFSFLPEPDRVLYVDVNESIPVSAFGFALPKVSLMEFSLPWTMNNELISHTTKGIKSRTR